MENKKHIPIVMANLSYQGKFLRAWDFVGTDQWRLYFKKSNCFDSCQIDGFLHRKGCEEKHGFDFAAVEWISSNAEHNDIWANDTEVSFLFNGIAMFDGVRHMYLGCDQNEVFGYVNYPNLEILIDILKEIRKLEIEFCRE